MLECGAIAEVERMIGARRAVGSEALRNAPISTAVAEALQTIADSVSEGG